jgi:hypothetical protein
MQLSMLALAGAVALSALAGGCSNPRGTAGDAGGTLDAPPTTSVEELQAWLAQASYKSWHCEAAPHAARSPSPHGTNRICSNELSSGHAIGEYPVDAAAVKEIYDSTGNVHAYAVYRHVSAGSDGANWFWFEAAGSDVYAFGLGDGGRARDSCVTCHSRAGSDVDHPGHDFVYTQVR